VKKKRGTLRKGKSAPESDSEEKPSVFIKRGFEQALRKVSRRVSKASENKT
jgi:hypothetical protein